MQFQAAPRACPISVAWGQSQWRHRAVSAHSRSWTPRRPDLFSRCACQDGRRLVTWSTMSWNWAARAACRERDTKIHQRRSLQPTTKKGGQQSLLIRGARIIVTDI
jgi:hypothetical protein